MSDEAKQQMKMQSEADTVPLVLDTLEEKIEDKESDKDKQHVSPPSLSPAHIAMKFSSVYPEEEEEEEEVRCCHTQHVFSNFALLSNCLRFLSNIPCFSFSPSILYSLVSFPFQDIFFGVERDQCDGAMKRCISVA